MTVNLDLGYTRLIIDQCRHEGVLRNQAAYILATTKWETAHTMEPVEEGFYLGPEKAKAHQKSLRYYPWHGRGFVGLTWEENYKLAGDRIGVDLVADKDLALRPEYAVIILVAGMMEGWFTKYRLPEFVTLQRSDFRNARKVVNAMDEADTIAAIARDYDAALLAEGYGVEPAAPPAVAQPRKEHPVPSQTPVPAGRGALEVRRLMLVAAGMAIAQTGVASFDEASTTLSLDLEALADELEWVIAAAVSGGGSVWWWKLASRLGGRT